MYHRSLKPSVALILTILVAYMYVQETDGDRICISKSVLRGLVRQEVEKYMYNDKKLSDIRLKETQEGSNLTSTKIQMKKQMDLRKRLVFSSGEGNVAFDALLSRDHENTGNGVIVKFDKILTNVGNAYDKNTGVFQAPFEGTYLFSWTISADYTSSIKTHLEKNGVAMATLHTDSSSDTTHHFIASGSKVSILTLSVGDRVYIQGDAASRGTIASNYISGHSGFSGTLLFT